MTKQASERMELIRCRYNNDPHLVILMFLTVAKSSMPGNLEAGAAPTGSHRNTWVSIGIPGNLEAGAAPTGSHGDPWGSIGIPRNLEAGAAPLGAIGILGDFYRNTW